jgi:hypothetical protein
MPRKQVVVKGNQRGIEAAGGETRIAHIKAAMTCDKPSALQHD